MITNKYNIQVSDETILEILKNLPGQFYKMLPIYEGRDFFTKEISKTEDESYEIFCKYLKNFIIKFSGAQYFYPDEKMFTEIFTMLIGLEDIQMGEHDKLKPIVLKCIQKIKETIYTFEKSR